MLKMFLEILERLGLDPVDKDGAYKAFCELYEIMDGDYEMIFNRISDLLNEPAQPEISITSVICVNDVIGYDDDRKGYIFEPETF